MTDQPSNPEMKVPAPSLYELNRLLFEVAELKVDLLQADVNLRSSEGEMVALRKERNSAVTERRKLEGLVDPLKGEVSFLQKKINALVMEAEALKEGAAVAISGKKESENKLSVALETISRIEKARNAAQSLRDDALKAVHRDQEELRALKAGITADAGRKSEESKETAVRGKV